MPRGLLFIEEPDSLKGSGVRMGNQGAVNFYGVFSLKNCDIEVLHDKGCVGDHKEVTGNMDFQSHCSHGWLKDEAGSK